MTAAIADSQHCGSPGRIGLERLYTRQFFQMFGAVALLMTGVSLQFHFGQYIQFLGHGVDALGRILSLSVVGTLLLRLHMGRWIDRFGCRATWLVGSLVLAATVGAMQLTDRLWLITILRTASTIAVAMQLTVVASFAALIAPPRRRAESIGTMGMAGFAGMLVGPALGDWIFAGGTESIVPYRIFFLTSAVCALASGIVMAFMENPPSRGLGSARSQCESNPVADHEIHKRSPSQLRIVVNHWPGMVLLVSVIFAIAFCWQSMFLERLAEAREFHSIKWFFLVYAPTAMILRLVFRRLPEQIGRTRTLILGLVLLGIGQLCLIGSHYQAALILPGVLMGAGHCFVFPSMVDLAAERLPPELRGTGTALVLGAGDLGMLIGFTTLGELIDRHGFDTALGALAATMFTGAAVMAFARRGVVFRRRS